MLLSQKFIYKPNQKQQIILGCLGYASAKLWNIANYEKKHYKELSFEKFPNWYDQKKRLKDNFWYKNLPSQTAQEILNVLQQGWASYFTLLKTKGIDEPNPPKFKKKNSKHNFVFLLNGFVVLDNNHIRFSLSKQLKSYLKEKYAIDDTYLILKIKGFSNIEGKIKQIEFKPCKNNTYEIFVIYEIGDVALKASNANYLSIDIGSELPPL